MSVSKIPRQSMSNINGLQFYGLVATNNKTQDTFTWDLSSLNVHHVWWVSDCPVVADSRLDNWNISYTTKTVTLTKPSASSGADGVTIKVLIAFD